MLFPSRSDVDEQHGKDPCLQIQIDLSAMLDGELDAAGVRRVTVHSDFCPQCRDFLDGIRSQVRLHNKLAAVGLAAGGTVRASALARGGTETEAGDRLRRELTANQLKLSRVLYELGRNFALMGLSPDFSREVAREPVPVPDMAQRGRNLLDEFARSSPAGDGGGCGGGGSWVPASDLFDGQVRSPAENLARGQRLLTECLLLAPDSDDARIYLGLVHYARGQRALARKQFQQVIERTDDALMRAYALSNLSNLLLDEGDCDGAVGLLLELVGSGVVDRNPRLTAAFFNLGLAYGLKGGFRESQQWFGRLHEAAPHRRRWAATELAQRSHFLHLIQTHPEARELAAALAAWFPRTESCGRSSIPDQSAVDSSGNGAPLPSGPLPDRPFPDRGGLS